MGGTYSIQSVNLNLALKKAAIRYPKRWQPFIIQLQIRIFERIMFMDFIHRPMFFSKTQCFGNWICLRLQVKRRWRRKRCVLKKNIRRWTKSRSMSLSSKIHHCQNPLEQPFSVFLPWRNPLNNFQVSGNPCIKIIISTAHRTLAWSVSCRYNNPVIIVNALLSREWYFSVDLFILANKFKKRCLFFNHDLSWNP
jgi:hypothetical protein